MQNHSPLVAIALLLTACAAPIPSFATPEAALQALVDSAEDRARADELLGAGGFDVLLSGDDVADQEDIEHVRALIRQKVAFAEKDDDTRIAHLGDDEWPLPIPIVRDGDQWRFDVEAGREEVLNRRVGRNELATIATLQACVEAQQEYAAEPRDGAPRAFAAKFASAPGKHDGLYWPVEGDEPESPLGPLVAAATREGYEHPSADEGPVPYHGYYYRILTAQGPSAPGGARNYADAQGKLRSGFAILAWPATYDNSGIKTFVIGQQGIVYEKDLGEDTADVVAKFETFDPDASWLPAQN